MPIYLIPAQYTSSTQHISLNESVELKEVGDKVIVTSMGEVSFRFNGVTRCKLISFTSLRQLLPMSFGPEDLALPQTSRTS